jgi:hypothetical protein
LEEGSKISDNTNPSFITERDSLLVKLDSSLDIDANKVLDQVATAFKWRPSSYTRKEIDGGIWVTAVEDGKILSAFWHPTKAHKTSVIGKVEVRGDWVPAGQTAISIGNSALFGNKAYYDIKSN